MFVFWTIKPFQVPVAAPGERPSKPEPKPPMTLEAKVFWCGIWGCVAVGLIVNWLSSY
jgi:hypothetical protein